MTSSRFTWQHFLNRFVFALLLVYLSYNPTGYSFYHWTIEALFGDALIISPPFAFSAIVLMIGWTIFIRATLRSLGRFGLTLAFLFFAILIWWLVDMNIINVDNMKVITYLALLLFAAILATGMSWSHIRRRMSGQADVDDIEQ